MSNWLQMAGHTECEWTVSRQNNSSSILRIRLRMLKSFVMKFLEILHLVKIVKKYNFVSILNNLLEYSNLKEYILFYKIITSYFNHYIEQPKSKWSCQIRPVLRNII